MTHSIANNAACDPSPTQDAGLVDRVTVPDLTPDRPAEHRRPTKARGAPRNLFSRFRRNCQGSIMAISGVMLPMVMGAALFGVDHMRAVKQLTELQDAADSAALAASRQMSFILLDEGNTDGQNQTGDGESETLTAVAAGIVNATLAEDYPGVLTKAKLVSETRVNVELTSEYHSLFGKLGFLGDNPFTVEATAETFGGENICLIALGPDPRIPAIDMQDGSHLNGENCGVYSGASSTDAIILKASAKITSTLVCSTGGFSGDAGNVSVPVTTDCQQVEDPLASRRMPRWNVGCDHTDLTLDGGTHTLEPGDYCGITELKNGADVWLNPGTYIFRDGGASGIGELRTHDTSRLAGNRVGLHFRDLKSQFKFLDQSEINLSAPTTGAMAGILVSSVRWCDDGIFDPTNSIVCPSNKIHEIRSSNVRSLLGTIHLAWDELLVDTTMPVSSEAAFTIVVIGKLTLKKSPTLVLNTDYAATIVPVPEGFEGATPAGSRLLH